MSLRTTLPLRRPTIITPPLGVSTPHTKTLTVGTTPGKTSAPLLFEPSSDGKSHVADVGPSARHAASTHLEPEASHGLNLENSVRKQASSEPGTKRKRAWEVADEVEEVNTESEKVDTKPDSSSSRLNLSSESDSFEAFGDGDGSDMDGNVPSETALDDEPDDTFELKGAQAYIDNSRKSSTEEPDAKSLEDQLGQIRRDLQALHAMLEPVITRLPPVVEIFVATPFFYKQWLRRSLLQYVTFTSVPAHDCLIQASSPAVGLSKSGLVPTAAYNKNLPFRHNLLSNIPALLVQGRSDLLRYIHKSQKDKATLGRTIN
ncbi:BQ5605_C004g03101 [Microbotryum silenes-dioicae]|uniref:BQ5605_C004g03101 protein n=1 Tax=Microbotryum silenes-dioicae TaxID=796604 RepID=A0A2X0P587_9BASI|nr:BQ5605_C004g03101 [Microbotryum silenes-dioicae]